MEPITDLSVCITNFGRANYLDRSIKSCVDNGIKNIVVCSHAPDAWVYAVTEKWGKQIKWHSIESDLGCAELWLQCAYFSPTDRMILLHDDDLLAPSFNEHYHASIKPMMDSGDAEFISWRAHLYLDNGSIKPTEWFNSKTGPLSSGHLRTFLLRLGRLSLSPIVSVMRRNTLIKAVKEGNSYLYQHQQCLHHPGMVLGTEIIAYLRHCADHPKWGFVNEVLSYYGCCDSSGTVKVQKTGDLACITKGYDIARQYFMKGLFENPMLPPKIIWAYDSYRPTDAEALARNEFAHLTWEYHFEQGDVLNCPTGVDSLGRSSADLGDDRPVPFFKDVINHGMAIAQPEDVVAYCNSDIVVSSRMPETILDHIKQHGISLGWRRSLKPEYGRMYKTFKNCKKDGGIDLICFTPQWWSEHSKNLPDMLIGREAFDWVLWKYALGVHGHSIFMEDIIGHEPHQSFWKVNRKTNKGQMHNRALAKIFFARRNDRVALQSLQ